MILTENLARWADKWLHWHEPDCSPKSFDGCSIHSICKHCRKKIMQDSQGNWF